MLTALGKYLRKLRIDKGEYLKDMASKLNVTVSFLSAVENGNKKMPSEWNRRICDLYELNKKQARELAEAIAETEDKIEINIRGAKRNDQYLAVSFARKFSDFDERRMEMLRKLLEDD